MFNLQDFGARALAAVASLTISVGVMAFAILPASQNAAGVIA